MKTTHTANSGIAPFRLLKAVFLKGESYEF